MPPDPAATPNRRPSAASLAARRITMKDVAEAAGVSRATVSLVVRDSPQIPTKTKQRVRETIERLGYVYDRRAAVMRSSRTMTVAMIVTDVRNPYFAELTMAIEIKLQEVGFALLLGYSHDQRDREDQLLEVMVQHHVDGVLLLPSKGTTRQDLDRRLGASATPHVLLARQVAGHEADYVGVDNVRAGQLLGDHLALEGCHRVAFLGGPSGSTARVERQQGLSKGLRRHRIAFDRSLSIATSADRVGGREALTMLLDRGELPDAIVCYSDVVAFGVALGLRARGIEPGAGVALASFDDIAEAELQHPPLTSVATYPERVGEEAARLLCERLDFPDEAPQQILLSPRLSVRASSTTRRTRHSATDSPLP
jgi:LacI family transcriptional regulator